MSDVECPYCGAYCEINHDDGYGYYEDEKYEQECGNCEKIFAYTTSIVLYYKAKKADCLNGADHEYQPTKTYPREYTRMQCIGCGHERPCTTDEMIEARKQ